jgi:hypothetical protein
MRLRAVRGVPTIAGSVSFAFPLVSARLGVSGLWLALASTLICCGRHAPPPVVPRDIRPSVTVAPSAVEAGGPVAIRYDWTLGPSEKPLEGRYRAFVHFLDDEGALLFTDDHEPVPPPAAWQRGHSYSYRRVTLTPEFPFAGVAVVVLGLYEESTGRRVSLTGDDIGLLRFYVSNLRLLPRNRDTPVRCEGFYEPEAAVTAPLFVSRFMRSEVTCSFPNPSEDVVVFVRGDIEPEGFTSPPRLSLTGTARRNAVTWWQGDLPLTTEAIMLRVRVPSRELGKRPDATFKIHMSQSYSPRTFGLGDPRDLSLRVLGLYVGRGARLDPALLEGVAAASR